jgi:hypothetical protein
MIIYLSLLHSWSHLWSSISGCSNTSRFKAPTPCNSHCPYLNRFRSSQIVLYTSLRLISPNFMSVSLLFHRRPSPTHPHFKHQNHKTIIKPNDAPTSANREDLPHTIAFASEAVNGTTLGVGVGVGDQLLARVVLVLVEWTNPLDAPDGLVYPVGSGGETGLTVTEVVVGPAGGTAG